MFNPKRKQFFVQGLEQKYGVNSNNNFDRFFLFLDIRDQTIIDILYYLQIKGIPITYLYIFNARDIEEDQIIH